MRIAIIPARGGSKRIPRKNIRLFCGQPIIAYSIAAARDSGVFDRIVVSTDDDEIAAVAEACGAEAPFRRSARLADDFTGTNAVVADALRRLHAEGAPISRACCIYATAPMLRGEDIRRGLEMLETSRKAFAFSVTSFPFPIQRAVTLAEDGTVAPVQPEHMATRSQDLVHAYHDAGQFYWGTAEAFLADLPLFSPHSVGVVLPRYRVQDIDTLEDWERAELMFKACRLGS